MPPKEVRLRELMRALKQLDIAVEPPSSGSHWKLRRPGARVYTLPCGNGERSMVPAKYLRAMCAHFAIEFDLLVKLL